MAASVIGNNKGGVGKDIVAEGAYLAARKQELKPLLIEVEINKRLSKLYPEAIHVPVGVSSPDVLYRNPDAAFAPLDEAMSYARSADLAIISLGANITQAFEVWSQTSGSRFFGDGAALTFAIVLTHSRDAVADGLASLFELGRLYPASRRFAILNEFVADFIDGDTNLAMRLEEARGGADKIETVKLRRMAAPAWGTLQNMGSLPQIAAVSIAELIAFGVPEGPAIRSLAMVERWIDTDLITPMARLLPPPAAPKKVKARSPS